MADQSPRSRAARFRSYMTKQFAAVIDSQKVGSVRPERVVDSCKRPAIIDKPVRASGVKEVSHDFTVIVHFRGVRSLFSIRILNCRKCTVCVEEACCTRPRSKLSDDFSAIIDAVGVTKENED
jgi:hypothetical protein